MILLEPDSFVVGIRRNGGFFAIPSCWAESRFAILIVDILAPYDLVSLRALTAMFESCGQSCVGVDLPIHPLSSPAHHTLSKKSAQRR